MSKGDNADIQRLYDLTAVWLRDCVWKGDVVGVQNAEFMLKQLEPQLTETVETPTTHPAPQAKAGSTIENVRKKFSEDLTDKLEFEAENNNIIIKGKTFLNTEVFHKVLDAVLAQGGKYVPASNNTHPYFVIPEVHQK